MKRVQGRGVSVGLPRYRVVRQQPVSVEMHDVRAFDSRSEEGRVISELDKRSVSSNLDLVQRRFRREDGTGEGPLRRVDDDFVTSFDQVTGESEDVRLDSALLRVEMR